MMINAGCLFCCIEIFPSNSKPVKCADITGDKKIMTSAWSEKNYLGLADIPLNTRVSVSFQFSAKGVSYLRSVEVI